jgi:hypothetical protein
VGRRRSEIGTGVESFDVSIMWWDLLEPDLNHEWGLDEFYSRVQEFNLSKNHTSQSMMMSVKLLFLMENREKNKI